MRPRIITLAIVTVLAVELTACASVRHYRAYLLESAGQNSFREAGAAIVVPHNERVCLDIDRMRVGFLHRDTSTGIRISDRGLTAFENKLYDWTGGRDLWPEVVKANETVGMGNL